MFRLLAHFRSVPELAFVPVVALALAALPSYLHLSGTGSGFDPAVAHLLLVLTALSCIAIYAAASRDAVPLGESTAGPVRALPVSAIRWTPAFEALIVAFLVLAAYFPPFLARYGPIGEDKYFLSAVQRVLVGQDPYVDFEFIYGPLLIVPLTAWMDAFGYSLQSYYWFLALLEGMTFGLLTLALGAAIPDRGRRLLVLLALLVLLVNDNLGLSWTGLRRALPILILLLYALRHRWRWGNLAVAALIGAQFVLSVEYAAACIGALGVLALIETYETGTLIPVMRACAVIGLGLATGSLFALMLLGGGTMDWLTSTWRVIALRGGGEAGFPFQVSANALAVLGLLFLACAQVGKGLPRLGRTRLESGDRFLLASLAYGLILFKSGLARSDMYHLVPPVLGLVVVALLPFRFGTFAVPSFRRRAGTVAVVFICATYAPGLAGAGRLWAQALVLGGMDVLSGQPTVERVPSKTRGPWIGAERTEIDPALADLAEHLAEPAHATAPVVYYGDAWGVDRHIGVAKPEGIYPIDDYLVSDDMGFTILKYLKTHPDALVIITRTAWEFLPNGELAPPMVNMYWILRVRSPLVRFLEVWSSSHYGTAVIEEQIRKHNRWRRTVGVYLRDLFVPTAEFGNLLVLARKS